MAREYARIRISIAEDEDIETLSADAQWLYFRVLIPEPSLSYAGIADWRPKRLVGKARDMTLDRIMIAAAELERARYALFDVDTEEVLARTYIRSDELLRNPKMAASMIKAYRSAASKTLRAAIVSEVQKAKTEHPEYTSWNDRNTKDDLAKLLDRPNLETVGYTNRITNRNGDADPVRNTNGIPNRNTNLDLGPDHQSEHQSNSVDSLPAPNNTHHSPANTVGYVSGERYEATAIDSDAPPPRCPRHLNDPTEVPCRACGDARERRAAWDRKHTRVVAEAEVAERRRLAEVTRTERAACPLCDDDGYRNGRVCDHDPKRDETNRVGIERARAALLAAQAGGKS